MKKIVLLAFVLTFLSLEVNGRFVSADIVGVSITQEVAPDFTLTDIDGNAFSLSDYRGKVVLLNFFLNSCSSCIAEIPHLKSLYEEFGEKLVIISISPENETVLMDFREGQGIEWTIAKDTANVFDTYNVSYTPTLVVIDQQGCICYRHVGLTEESVLRPEIESLLPKMIYVDDDNVAGPWNGTKEHPYKNITSGLEHASDKDTVFVQNGTYYENVVVNKSISLIGEDKDTTIIDGNKTGDAVEVKANNVSISEFTIRNGDIYGWHAGWGVYIRDSSRCRISENNVINNKGGICVEYGSSIESADCIIEDNLVNNNFEGISLYRSDNCIITRNNVTNSRNSGIYLFASSYCTITGNHIENTQSYGIYLRYLSNNNTIHHNSLIDNGIQASVSNSMSHPRNNTWDNGLEGNYWSDYEEKYPNATEIDGLGIWDTPYVIDENNQDNYPIVPEFPTLTSTLLILIMLTVVIAIYKRRLHKTPIR